MDKIICIVGPTAAGKTKLSVALAKALGGEIVGCDSMQIYRGMDIGTAKVTPQELEGVPHYMSDVAQPGEDFSVSRYVQMADACVQDILSRGKTVIIEGGTGLYVDSLIAGRSFAPYPRTGHREALEKLAEEYGIEAVLELLQNYDAESAARLHPSDRKRIIRAAEVYLETGKSITQHNLESKRQPPKYDPVWIGLDYESRQDLYDRINRRVERMLQDGLMDEVNTLLSGGLDDSCTAMQALGYKELAQVQRGELSVSEAVALIQRRTRNFAKRQLTWFRKNPQIFWILQTPNQDFSEIFLQARQHIPFFDKG